MSEEEAASDDLPQLSGHVSTATEGVFLPWTKAAFINRCKREGRWYDVNLFIEAERTRFKRQGKKAQAARDYSWHSAMAKFPPLHTTLPEKIATDLEKIQSLAERIPLSRMGTREHIVQWVLNHVGVAPHRIKLPQVPSRAALVCLVEAYRDAKFKRELMKILLMDRRSNNTESTVADEHDRSLIDLARIHEDCLAPPGSEGHQKESGLPGELDGEGEPGQRPAA